MSRECLETDLGARLGQARAELENRLRAGEAARAEDYFAADPALASDLDSALELIYAEFVTRDDLGQTSGHDEWCERFPSWERDLRDLFRIHDLMKESLEEGFPHDAAIGEDVDPIQTGGDASHGRLGHFELLEEVGRGGMAQVYKARDLNLGRLVALKMIRPEVQADSDPSRFRAEAEAVARLQHPNIVQIYEIFEAGGRSFISFEFIEGGSLKQAMLEGPQSPRAAASLLEVVARAIAYAHHRGVVHLDLKPANVLLTIDGVPKVVDFGLARQFLRDRSTAEAEAHANPAGIFGTIGYMAPEQCGGALDHDGLSADVYALGAILYELLTGRTPCGVDSYLAYLSRGTPLDPPPPSRLRPKLPRDLEAICLRCLQAEPIGRYPDAGALADDLRRYLAGEPVHARAVGTWECGWKWARRRPAMAALASVSVLATFCLLVGSFWYNTRLSALARRAEQQAVKLSEQLEFSRRSLYALQLTHVEGSLESNPGLGRVLLEDVRYCPPDLRDFSWGYFYRLCKRKRVDLRKHHLGLVNAVAFSPDGRILAIASGRAGDTGPPGQVKLFEPNNEKSELGTLIDPLGPILDLAFSPDGCTLATAGGSSGPHAQVRGVLRLWDVGSRTERRTVDENSTPVLRVVFSPDGRLLATTHEDGSVKLRDARTGERYDDLRDHTGAVRGLAFSPEGVLATGGDDGILRLWDGVTGPGRRSWKGHSGRINAIAFSPDGSLLASAGTDKVAMLWDLAERRPRAVLRGHLGAVLTVAFSPDGDTVITGGEESIVRLWRAEDGREVTALNIHDAPVTSLAFNPTGDLFASGSLDQTAKVWDFVPGRQRPPWRGHEAKVTAALFTPDGRTLITAGLDRTIRLWDAAEGQVRATLRDSDRSPTCLTLAPDGWLLAAGSSDGSVSLRGIKGNRGPWALLGPSDTVTSLAFSPDGQTLAAASRDERVRLWDIATNRCRSTFRAHVGGVYRVAFSPDGKTLATAGEDRMVRLWDPDSGKELAALKGHTLAVISLGFHPHERRLASGGKDRIIRLWDLTTKKEIATLWGHNHWVSSIVFSPDGRTMASSTGVSGPNAVGEVKLWDALTGHVRATFQGKTAPIAFSPDGRSLLTGNHDETVNLLEVAAEFSAEQPSGRRDRTSGVDLH